MTNIMESIPEGMHGPLLFLSFVALVLLNTIVTHMWRKARNAYFEYVLWKTQEEILRDKLENKRLRKAFYERRLMYGRAAGATCSIDPEHLVEGQIVYTYRTDRPFYVTSVNGRYGLNCSVPMVCYRNIFDTDDAESDTLWHLEESIFLKQFYTYGENINDYNEQQIKSMAS